MKLKITAKEIRAIGYPEGPVISVAMSVMHKHYKFEIKENVIELLMEILRSPLAYQEDSVLGIIVAQLLPKEAAKKEVITLTEKDIQVSVFGQEYIDEQAFYQMGQAMKLPISAAGSLMPDAHSGYGLPIGGVLATENAVIPYGVGVDIGCTMCLSVFDIDPGDLMNKEAFFMRELNDATLFGSGSQFSKAADHEIMEHPLFAQLPLLKSLHGKAWRQLGSSGSGNHFADFGIVEINEEDKVLGIPSNKYIGFLTHSGSRALGAHIADHYTKIAMHKRQLPSSLMNLAWLTLDEAEGIEYWMSMNLAGNYASACHQVMHEKIKRRFGRAPISVIENRHNFAWKEMLNNKELIVHRKGATPAGKDVLGIIPGSMTANGFIVKGKGLTASINSASHGAGRKMSRRHATASVTNKQFKEELQRFGVKLLGGGLDESPFAYKDIHRVMQSQKALVDIIGKFTPKIVKMDGAKHRSWKNGGFK